MQELPPPPPSSRPNFSVDRERILAVAAPVLRAHGAELVDVEFKSERRGWVLRLFIEKAGSSERNASTKEAAVDLALCSNVARDLSPALDVADIIPHRYHLEVSSPGVERPLRTLKDYVRFSGQKAKLRLKAAIKGQKVLVGKIAAKGDTIVVDDSGRSVEVPFSEIEQARLVFEFGPPSSKPGKKRR
jgi:ribosome maturation factor RimP